MSSTLPTGEIIEKPSALRQTPLYERSEFARYRARQRPLLRRYNDWIARLSWPRKLLAGAVIVAAAFVAGLAGGEALEWLLYAPAPEPVRLGD